MEIGNNNGVHSRTQNGKISAKACIDGLTRPSETDGVRVNSSFLNAGASDMSGEVPIEECNGRKRSQEAMMMVRLSLFWHVGRTGNMAFSAQASAPSRLPPDTSHVSPTEDLHSSTPCRRLPLAASPFACRPVRLFIGGRRQSSAVVLAFLSDSSNPGNASQSTTALALQLRSETGPESPRHAEY
jgi:hypothetical protein